MLNKLTDYLNKTAEQYPNKIAFSDCKRSITFLQLQREAKSVATYLCRKRIFKEPVLVLASKSVDCIVAMMGILYSGNFYSIMDCNSPELRIKNVIHKLETKTIIDCGDVCINNNFGCEKIYLSDITGIEADDFLITRNSDKILETDVMFVLFTSGSTGTPKGVVTLYKAVKPYIDWCSKLLDIDDTTIFANQVPFYFIFSCVEIFQTIKTGATMYIIPKELFSYPVLLLEELKAKKANTLIWVPSIMCLLANYHALPEVHLDDLKLIMFGGEVMPCKQLNMWRKEYPNVTFINDYGPTELMEFAAYYKVNREFDDTDKLPIGLGVDHTELILLDTDGHIVKDGEIGEICGRGISVSPGYYNDKETTDNVFIQNPLNERYADIIYKTGDLAYINQFGELVYAGRKDFQIKHMGHRIELGEVESAISSLSGVDCICSVYDSIRNHILVAYTGNIENSVIFDNIGNILPNYMLPKRIVKIDMMPLNDNGKIDRNKVLNYLIEEN